MALLQPGTEMSRYTILGKLATGGMSEIYLARQSGPSGFSKVLVLKVILPHLADDPSFMQMFQNEAKLAALLNHPNVVQIFDFGVAEQGHFMAMEYIDGRNLRRIIKALKQARSRIPRPVALRIISDTCGALQYAHGLTDPSTGAPLRVIHRDVSLENILITYSGQVKLVDFGIAKATILESYTTQGTLKGKYSYMAPELIRGASPDNRIDIYAAGVVLYSALLGKLPFTASNQAQLLDKILNQDPPRPRELDPELPEELEAIVLKALHKDRERRYQSAGQIQAEIESYLQRENAVVMPSALSQFMIETFPAGTDKDRETYHSLTGASSYTPTTPGKGRPKPKLEPEDPPTGTPAGFASPLLAPASGEINLERFKTQITPPPDAMDAETREIDAPPEHERGVQAALPPPGAPPAPSVSPIKRSPSTAAPLPPGPLDAEALVVEPSELTLTPPRSRWTIVVAVVAVAVGVSIVALLLLTRGSSPSRDQVVVVGASDAGAGIQDAMQVASRPGLNQAPPPDSAAPKPTKKPAPQPAPKPAPKRARKPTPKPNARPGALSISCRLPGQVSIDGKAQGALPLHGKRLSAGTHVVVVKGQRPHFHMVRKVQIRSGGQVKLQLKPRHGRIRVLVRPWAKVTLDGRRLGVTPLPRIQVYEGSHSLVLRNDELASTKRRRVTVRPGGEVTVKVQMGR
jgi:eukaryotic-like serine/threonine-protein kinase